MPSPGPQFYPVSAIDYLTGYLMAFGAMVALGRRAREGGSWLVPDLAGADRPLAGRSRPGIRGIAQGCAEGDPQADVDRWSIDSDTATARAAASSGADRRRDPLNLASLVAGFLGHPDETFSNYVLSLL